MYDSGSVYSLVEFRFFFFFFFLFFVLLFSPVDSDFFLHLASYSLHLACIVHLSFLLLSYSDSLLPFFHPVLLYLSAFLVIVGDCILIDNRPL